jgi:ATP-dependent DNA ligase
MKYDGYRIHARLTNGKVTLLTRTRLDRTDAQKITAQATCFRTRNP